MNFLKLFSKENKSLTEAQLMEAYRITGELRLVGALYQPYMQMVFTICYKYLRNEEESKDAVMNIFEKLVSDLKIHDVDNFKSWLHSVARNHCLMQIRRKKEFVTINEKIDVEESYYEIDSFTGENDTLLDGNLDAMEKCLDMLAQEQRVSINLFFKEEKCYREISDQTGFDFNKVKSYIQNGKRNLKICMERNGTRKFN